MTGQSPRTGFVAIGRNEGERLKRCLRSMPTGFPVVYVDSGSTDGSVSFAESIGVIVERLSTEQGFTAARARNAGWRSLLDRHPQLDFVHFVDGDCELDADWLAQAERALGEETELCAVFGRRRERFPQASRYNALCDDEWNVPVGLVESCGGDVLFRVQALREAGGYSDDLIAGEEPDLCLRLSFKGWRVRRIDAEMTLHDAAITSFRQMWLRFRRAGHAFAEHVARHGERAFPSWRRQCRSMILWGALLPALIILLLAGALVAQSLWLLLAAALLVLIYPAQMLRIAFKKMRQGAEPGFAIFYGYWMVLSRFAQLGGLVRYHWKRSAGVGHRIIEYKG